MSGRVKNQGQRNPGCGYCVFYQAPSEAMRNEGGCLKNGRRISKKADGITYYKWIECENPRLKNNISRCGDFRLQNFFLRYIRQLFKEYTAQLRRHVVFQKTAFVGEDWLKQD